MAKPSRKARRCLFAALLLSSAQVHAADLDEAIRSAWQRATEGRQAEGESRRAEAGKRAARSLAPEPLTLELSQYSGRWYGDEAATRETEVGVALPLWMPGQRKTANRAADSDLAWAGANAEVARLELARRVREAAWGVVEQRGARELAAARVHSLEQVGADVRRRVRVGELAETDGMAAESETLAAQVELDQAQRELLDAQAQWQLLTGLDEVPDPERPAPAAAAEPAQHPAVLRARYEAERARERLELARQSRRAAPELSIGVKDERSEEIAGDTVRSLGVALRVPLGSRSLNAPRLAEAENELALAENAQRLALEAQTREIALAREGEAAAMRQLEAARQGAELLRRRAQLLRRSFDAGEIALVDLLRALEQSAEADSALASRRTAHGLAIARLLQAYGTSP